ncbi:MAG: hypothetical protein LBT21_07115 [Oscillospiraceae bacterium]|nr:hypothetical protein [Oscillospiraceae bacterium]
MKKSKRILALLLVFGLLFGIGGMTVSADEPGSPPTEDVTQAPEDDANAAQAEFTDLFQSLLDWLGDNFGQQIADVFTNVLLKVGTALAKVGVKLVLKTVVKSAIKGALPF